jgi:hypothetical protein
VSSVAEPGSTVPPVRISLGWTMPLLLAVLAGVYQGVAVARANNDTFLHLAMSRQWIGGDLPVRDFFDSGLVLMYVASGGAQWLFGYRLLAEAIVVGVMAGVATLLAGRLVLRLTGSVAGALVAQLLVLLAAPRPYSYPKLIVYAVLASLWWAYVARPAHARLVLLGAWVAVSFYFRPDHGVLAALFVVLAVGVALGTRPAVAARHLVVAASVALALTAPFFVYVQRTIGFDTYLRSGLAQGRAEEVEMSGHSLPPWPVRKWADLFGIDPVERYAPEASLRWAAGIDVASRQALLARYHLTALDAAGDTTRVRMSGEAIRQVRALINEPAIADTAGIDRAAATVDTGSWPLWQRLGYYLPPFRLRLLPALDQQERGSDASTILFQLVPLLAIAAALLFRRRLTALVTPPRLVAFAAAAMAVNFVLIRTPYAVRTVDAVWLPAVLIGAGVGALFHLVRFTGRSVQVGAAIAVASFTLLAAKSVAVAGEFNGRVTWLSGEFRDLQHLRGAWSDIRARLVATPPIDYWRGKPAPDEVQLALYARDCLSPRDRLTVLWFAPEIYYYSDRLMGQRHLVFVTGWQALSDEQRLTAEKMGRVQPTLVFAKQDWRESSVASIYPRLVHDIQRDYDPVARFGKDDEYVVLARRGRQPVRRYGERSWPCYAYSS